ncbi:MAG: hypothetical protein GY936_02965 [Ignavibacteriae bacterium]|nr:hypothetical protein [Ignavibacteriota bacterium]
MKYFIKILSPVIIITGLYFLFRTKEIKQPSGILAPNKPIQKLLTSEITWEKNNLIYTALAEFEITNRVLSIRSYDYDELSKFCPLDIAAGWGQMSDQRIVDQIDIKQQHRWYVWSTKKFPIPQKELEASSTNIHIIPSNENIYEQFDDVIRGNIIFMKGYLVNVKSAENNREWKTSTKRSDTGGGACEILWVQELSIKK